jgi:hypothetical protein
LLHDEIVFIIAVKSMQNVEIIFTLHYKDATIFSVTYIQIIIYN